MQLIAEAYDLIRRGTGKTPAEIADVFAEWNKRRARELPDRDHRRGAAPGRRRDRQAARRRHPRPGGHRRAPASGPCRTRSTSASRSPGIAEAVFARALSSKPAQRAAASGSARPGRDVSPIADADAFIEDVRQALYASKIIAYSQGFDAIVAGAEQYGWDIKKGDIAAIWRGGCIIRARFLNRITEAYAADPGLVALRHRAVLRGCRGAHAGGLASRGRDAPRRPASRRPAFSSSLAYYDGLRADRLPAALVQGQRDFFGAHTYKRVDKDGTFHTLWSGDRSEVEATDIPLSGGATRSPRRCRGGRGPAIPADAHARPAENGAGGRDADPTMPYRAGCVRSSPESAHEARHVRRPRQTSSSRSRGASQRQPRSRPRALRAPAARGR